MIVRMRKNNNIKSTLRYHFQKIQAGNATIIGSRQLNFNPKNPRDEYNNILNSFRDQMPFDTRVKSPIEHISINPVEGTDIDDATLSYIAEEYLDKMGYHGVPFLIVKHDDLSRSHIHIVTLRVGADGKRLDGINDFSHLKSKEVMNEILESYPDIKTQEKLLREQQREKHRYQNGDLDDDRSNKIHYITNNLRGVVEDFNFTTIGELNAILSLKQIKAEEINDEATGKKGLIFYLLDDNGRISASIKSSELNKMYSAENISAVMKKNLDYRKSTQQKQKNDYYKKKTRAIRAITEELQRSTDIDTFKNRLKSAANIEMVTLKSKDGSRIFGVIFVDLTTKTAFKGGELSSKLKATAFNEWLQKGVAPNLEISSIAYNYAVSIAKKEIERILSYNNNIWSKEDVVSALEEKGLFVEAETEEGTILYDEKRGVYIALKDVSQEYSSLNQWREWRESLQAYHFNKRLKDRIFAALDSANRYTFTLQEFANLLDKTDISLEISRDHKGEISSVRFRDKKFNKYAYRASEISSLFSIDFFRELDRRGRQEKTQDTKQEERAQRHEDKHVSEATTEQTKEQNENYQQSKSDNDKRQQEEKDKQERTRQQQEDVEEKRKKSKLSVERRIRQVLARNRGASQEQLIEELKKVGVYFYIQDGKGFCTDLYSGITWRWEELDFSLHTENEDMQNVQNATQEDSNILHNIEMLFDIFDFDDYDEGVAYEIENNQMAALNRKIKRNANKIRRR